MTNITRTIYSSALQTAQVLGIDYAIPDNTTLNEKFDVLPTASIDDVYPQMKYWAMGRGGHRNASGPDGQSITRLNFHRASDAACFQHMPFVLRKADNDISAAARANYALRVEEVHGGVPYVAYYLRRLDHSNLEIGFNRLTVTNGNQTLLPYTPSSSDLSPTPLTVSPTEVNVTDGEYLSASTLVQLLLTEDEIAEAVAAAKVIYGEEEYATLSEVALCSGVDRVQSATSSEGLAFNYTEAIGVQVNTHIITHHQLWLANRELLIEFDLGGTESLTL